MVHHISDVANSQDSMNIIICQESIKDTGNVSVYIMTSIINSIQHTLARVQGTHMHCARMG